MIGRQQNHQQTLFIPGDIRDYIPDDHILSKVNTVLDLTWLQGAVEHLYCQQNGRPSIAPEAALRLMLAGFFLGIVHDRKLLREAQVNLAIRWFAGYTLTDSLPDHSSLTRIRQRWGDDLFMSLFDRVVRQCIDADLVSGETVHVDASLIRADVSWESLSRDHAQTVIDENQVSEPVDDNSTPKQNLPKKRGRPSTRSKLPKKKSATDPDASLSTNCQTKAMIPCLKQHTAVDDKNGIIVDIDVQTGDDSEGKRLPEVLNRVEARTQIRPHHVTADSGYAYGENYQFLEERKIEAIIPPQKLGIRKNAKLPSRRFKYDALKCRVRCPAGHELKPGTETEHGLSFRSSQRVCKACHLRKRCFSASAKSRVILIRKGYTSLLRARRRKERGWTKNHYHLYGRHRYQVEGVHGEAKAQHGLHRAVRRGRVNVLIQSLLTAVVINLKRLAAVGVQGGKPAAEAVLKRCMAVYICLSSVVSRYLDNLYVSPNISARF